MSLTYKGVYAEVLPLTAYSSVPSRSMEDISKKLLPAKMGGSIPCTVILHCTRGKRHVPGWQIHTGHHADRPGQSAQLLRRNIPGYQENFTLRYVVDNAGLVPPFQRKNTAPSVTGSDSAVQLPPTHG